MINRRYSLEQEKSGYQNSLVKLIFLSVFRTSSGHICSNLLIGHILYLHPLFIQASLFSSYQLHFLLFILRCKSANLESSSVESDHNHNLVGDDLVSLSDAFRSIEPLHVLRSTYISSSSGLQLLLLVPDIQDQLAYQREGAELSLRICSEMSRLKTQNQRGFDGFSRGKITEIRVH